VNAMARVSFAVLLLGAALATDETTASLRGSPAAATAAAAARRLVHNDSNSVDSFGGEPGSQMCSTQGNPCQPSIDGMPPISCCGELVCKQIIGGKMCDWPDTCAAPGQTCYDSVDGKPPLTCCGDSVCTQIIGGKQCQYPDTCAAPGETCYDSVDGKPPLTCCDGYECQQIPGGKRCASGPTPAPTDCDGMYYTKNYAEGTEHECRCDNWCDNFCDDEPNGCARTCRILNGVFEHTPSVHAGDRTCAWHAYSVSNPVNYEGYDCSWMAGTGEGGHGDNCQDFSSDDDGAWKCREGNQNQNNCHF